MGEALKVQPEEEQVPANIENPSLASTPESGAAMWPESDPGGINTRELIRKNSVKIIESIKGSLAKINKHRAEEVQKREMDSGYSPVEMPSALPIPSDEEIGKVLQSESFIRDCAWALQQSGGNEIEAAASAAYALHRPSSISTPEK